MKRRIKAVLGWLAFHSRLHRLFFKNRAVVVLFHRVDDRDADNPLSCSRAEFAAFADFFRRFFTVIPLSDLLERLARGDDLSGRLVITFDDGYLDNYRNAAPELRRRGLPACFFVATAFIGSTRVPWWDEERGIRSEWMSWEHLRDLHAQGFDIGAHTMNHVDLGVVEADTAVREITGSKVQLERELAAPVKFFTYPYGRVHQITEANREQVQKAGFECCLSAYGGSVVPGDAPFRIKRTAVSPWYVSPYQFGFEIMLSAS